MPIQQLFLGTGKSEADPLYIDDVFSTYLWKGTGGNLTHNNGLDLSSKGGMVWIKSYSNTYASAITDTVRGTTKQLQTSTNAGDLTNSSRLTAFNSNGFTTGYEELVGSNNSKYASWSWRKAEKFFDIQSWSGNLTSGRQISHNLKCVPGLILVKRNNGAANWSVFHAALGPTFASFLNKTDAASESSAYWNNTAPTDSVITLGNSTNVNGGSGDDYIAYIFGGGKSTAATARSVEFGSGANDLLHVGSSSDLSFGTGDFTIEGWFKDNVGSNMGIFQISSSSDGITTSDYANTIALGHNSGGWNPYGNGQTSTPSENLHLNFAAGEWIHFAYTRQSGTNRIFINGDLLKDWSSSYNYTHTYLAIGAQYTVNNRLSGEISNFRIVKGTAVYTSPFKPPTEPLTNITNTKLLCCNNSSVTGATVTPTTITTEGGGGLTAVTENPFIDPENYAFGANGDQNAIKVGRYNGTGSTSTVPQITCGWQPSWVMIKDYHDSGQDWVMFDTKRGIFNDNSTEDKILAVNAAETQSGGLYLDLTGNGFKITSSHNRVNSSTRKYIYVAFRMSDGGVGKIPDAGTGSLAMDYGSGSSSIPNFDSGFAVDFCLTRKPASSDNWYTGARLLGGKFLKANTNNSTSISGNFVFDSSLGWNDYSSWSTNELSYMFKRGPGFDVVTWKGNQTSGHHIAHSLGPNKVPEMIWLKNRDQTQQWGVGHKGLNGGTNPWNDYLILNETDAEQEDTNFWDATAPTATHLTVGSNALTNRNNDRYLAMLFCSVDKISKVGSYTGNGTSNSSSQEIVTGFAPRFLIVKKTSGSAYWLVLDTLRGWGSGDDKWLQLNDSAAQGDFNWGYPGPTGFVVRTNDSAINANNEEYIYYAHA